MKFLFANVTPQRVQLTYVDDEDNTQVKQVMAGNAIKALTASLDPDLTGFEVNPQGVTALYADGSNAALEMDPDKPNAVSASLFAAAIAELNAVL